MKRNIHWKCVDNCGACCYLAPFERQEALNALSDEDQRIYLDLVGVDGWCVHLDKSTKKCRIYKNRPDFCRVSMLIKLFPQGNNNFDKFAIKCCNEHIKSIYGSNSSVLKRFKHEVNIGK